MRCAHLVRLFRRPELELDSIAIKKAAKESGFEREDEACYLKLVG